MKKILAYTLIIILLLSFTPCTFALSASPYLDADIGDTVYFGLYEQDNNLDNGPEEIAWIVLERSEDRALVISEHALDCRPYNDQYAETDWESCTLRGWLNKTFVENAFTADERKYIQPATVFADKNPDYDSTPGRDTQDQIFLMSIKEINHYFNSDSSRFCIPTAYAVEQGCKTYPGTNACWWWTRTPGSDNYYATDVRGEGTVNTIGGEANRGEIGVRPAMWLSLSASSYTEAESMPAWKKAYSDLILETPRIEEWDPDTRDSENKSLLCAYSLYDIDKDDIPELFLHFGNSEDSEYGRLYTFRDGNTILLTLSRSRQIAGSGDGRWEGQSFPYGYNSFSTYPEGNGVRFSHEKNGQYFTLWSIDGEYVMESDILLRQDFWEVNSASVVYPGSSALTEFPAYTLLPLIRYEEWSQKVLPASNAQEEVSGPKLIYPNNDPRFFEKVVAGEIPVVPCLAPRLYGGWERYYFSAAKPASGIMAYPEMEGYLAVTFDIYKYLGSTGNQTPLPLPSPESRTILYADLNGDGKLEAICIAQFMSGSRRMEVASILSEQDGSVYAYGITGMNIKNADVNGIIYSCAPAEYIGDLIYEGAFVFFFDKEESFFVGIPLGNYAGVRCQPEEFGKKDLEQEIRYWQAIV